MKTILITALVLSAATTFAAATPKQSYHTSMTLVDGFTKGLENTYDVKCTRSGCASATEGLRNFFSISGKDSLDVKLKYICTSNTDDSSGIRLTVNLVGNLTANGEKPSAENSAVRLNGIKLDPYGSMGEIMKGVK